MSLVPLSALIITYREVDANKLGGLGEKMGRCMAELPRKVPMFVLHTCGRVEAYFYGAPREVVEAVAARYRAYSQLYRVLTGEEAARHLFEVAAGLDSILLGETDILGQLEEAYQRQVSAGVLRGFLKAVVERAVRAGKRVRSETEISRGPRGLGSLSIRYASRLLDLRQASVGVLGAGAVGSGLAMELASYGVGRLVLVNRTLEKAAELASRLGAEAWPLDEAHLRRCLMECDVVFATLHVMDHVIKEVPPGARVKLIVDLGVPQNVAPGLPVRVVRIEDLRPLAEEVNRQKEADVAKARAIVEEELAKLRRELAQKALEQILAPLVSEAYRIAEEEAARAGAHSDLAARSTAKRIILPLVESLKKMATDGKLEEAIKIAEFLYSTVRDGQKGRDAAITLASSVKDAHGG